MKLVKTKWQCKRLKDDILENDRKFKEKAFKIKEKLVQAKTSIQSLEENLKSKGKELEQTMVQATELQQE